MKSVKASNKKHIMLKDKFTDFISYRILDGAAHGTVNAYERLFYSYINPILGDKPIDELRKSDVVRLKSIVSQKGGTTPAHTLITLRMYLKYLVDEQGYRLQFDWRDIEVPTQKLKQIDSLSREEVEEIRQRLDTNTHFGLRSRAMIELILHSGMRIEEVVKLDKRDLDLFSKEAKITNCKTKEPETVSIAGATEWIERYLEFRRDYDCEALFLAGASIGGLYIKNKRLPKQSAKSAMRQIRKHVGLKKHLHWHLIRKTYVTLLLLGGLDIKSTQLVARHKSERTTLRHYAGIQLDQAREMANRIMVHV